MTQEELKLLLNYDKNTGEFTWKKLNKTSNRKLGQRAGSLHNKGYRHIRLHNKLYLEHRLAWLYTYGYFPKVIDHIDGNKLNNKLSNLRECTQAQNMWNTSIIKNTLSKVKGVSYVKLLKKWIVRVQINKNRKTIGYFDDLELAELVAIEARIKYHGEYCKEYT